MTDIQPGWYHAQGDPPGTQRYWDGAQWVGEPQAVNDPPPMAAQQPFGAPPASFAAPQAPFAPTRGGAAPAEWGQRVVAYLIDWGLGVAGFIGVFILTAIFSQVSSALGTLVNLVGTLAIVGYWIWNLVIRQGQTGQTIGKTKQNIRLISDATGQPVGPGMAFVRVLVAGVLSAITCGVVGLLDILWPLWDSEKKRLTDKILNMSVVQG